MIYKSCIRSDRHVMVAFDATVWTIPKGDPFFESATNFILSKDFESLVPLYQLSRQVEGESINLQQKPKNGQSPVDAVVKITFTEFTDNSKPPLVVGADVPVTLTCKPNTLKNTPEPSFKSKFPFEKMMTVDGVSMPASLAKQLLRLIGAGEPVAYLKNFWKRLSKNPSEGSRQQLFNFISKHFAVNTLSINFTNGRIGATTVIGRFGIHHYKTN